MYDLFNRKRALRRRSAVLTPLTPATRRRHFKTCLINPHILCARGLESHPRRPVDELRKVCIQMNSQGLLCSNKLVGYALQTAYNKNQTEALSVLVCTVDLV